MIKFKGRKIFNLNVHDSEKPEEAYPMPAALMAKYNKYLILAGLVFICGILTCFLLFSGFKILKASLFPIAIAFILFLDGLYFKKKITTKGYDIYEGVCVDHKYSNIGTKLIDADLSLRKYVVGALIECENLIISIPIPKGNDVAPIGSRMKVFVPKDALKRINHNGVTVFSNIFGYEIVPDLQENDEEMQRKYNNY